jgi:hypothetical protein
MTGAIIVGAVLGGILTMVMLTALVAVGVIASMDVPDERHHL